MPRKTFTYKGAFDPSQRAVAHWAFHELTRARSHLPFLTELDGKPAVIVPRIKPHGVSLIVIVGPLRRLGLDQLNDVAGATGEERAKLLANLFAGWKKYCRAFVFVSFDPSRSEPLKLHAANATRNMGVWLSKRPWEQHRLPELSELDARLGTVLEMTQADYAKEVGSIHATLHR